MRQLSPGDRTFLLTERPNSPSNATTVWIYDRSTVPGGKLDFDHVLEHFRARLPLVPALHQKLVPVPGGIDHPWWVEDPHFDLEHHVRHIALPPPGDWRQFWIQTARVHARPLDLTRPLWELYMIEGLDELDGVPPGAFALVLKMHHAAVDGRTSVAITEIINSNGTSIETPLPPTERPPSALELVARGAYHGVVYPGRAAHVMRELAPAVPRAIGRATHASMSITLAPRTRFSGVISPHRVLDGVVVDLDDVQAPRGAVEGATVNDVTMAVFGGALRAYLGEVGELPVTSLRAMMPVATGVGQHPGATNQLSARVITLATDIADPKERLATITAASMASRQSTSSPTDLGELIGLVPAPLMAPILRLASPLLRLASAGFNTLVSNVAGPRDPLELAGARLVLMAGGAPLSDGVGLFNYLQSYAGRAVFGFTACRAMMPDPQRYADCIRRSLDDLVAAT